MRATVRSAVWLSAAALALIISVGGFAEDLRNIVCADCHGGPVHDLLSSRHGAALPASGKRDAAELCGACHGEVSAHAKAQKPRDIPVEKRFKNLKREEGPRIIQQCLSCHGSGSAPIPQQGIHLREGLHCGTCHTGMGKGGLPKLVKSRQRELCGGCHPQALAPFRSGHRPDAAGALCTFCHDPHAEERPLVARPCEECHRAYSYPKAFEHPPVEEGCLGCHDPHGSAERFLLKEPRLSLCLGCHSQLESFHRVDSAGSPYRLYEACQNCHPRIHGSDAIGGGRFQR